MITRQNIELCAHTAKAQGVRQTKKVYGGIKLRLIGLTLISLFLIGCVEEDPSYVVVKAAGSVEVPIDYMKISIYVENSAKSIEQANIDNKKIVVQMFEIFKDFGIADSDFVTDKSEMQTDWSRDSRNSREEFLKVVYSGTLTLRNPSYYDKLFMKMSSLEKVRVSVNGFGSNNLIEYKQEAYALALGKASKQADLLLSGTNRSRGKVLRILQEGIDPYHMYDNFEDQIIESTNIQRNRTQSMALAIESENIEVAETWRKPTFSISSGAIVIYEIID